MRRFLAVGLTLLAVACSDPQAPNAPAAREPDATTVGHICGMYLAEHPGPKGQVFIRGQVEPLWFSSVRDTFGHLLGREGAAPVAVYVHDMAQADWARPQPGTWIEVHKAVFVIGSTRFGGMGEAEIIPFGSRAAASAFTRQHGGRVVAYDEVPSDYVFYGTDTPEQ